MSSNNRATPSTSQITPINIPINLTIQPDHQLSDLLSKFGAHLQINPVYSQGRHNINVESVRTQKLLKDAQQEIEELKGQLFESEKDYEEKESELMNEKNLTTRLRKELKEIQDQMQELKNEKLELEARNKAFEFELKNTKCKLGMTKHELDQLSRNYKASMEKIFQLELKLSAKNHANRTSTPFVQEVPSSRSSTPCAHDREWDILDREVIRMGGDMKDVD